MKRFGFVIFFVFIGVTSLLASNYDKSFPDFETKFEIEKFDDSIQEDKYHNVALLGVIQGVTEFLPVSSTGHMILAEYFLNKGKSSISYQEAMNSYFTIIQSGSILAILILYRNRILDMFRACFFRNKRGGYLIRDLLLSFLPAGLLGICLNGMLQNLLYNPMCIAYALIFGSFLMIFAERWYTKNGSKSCEITDLSAVSCIKIGLWQCLALIPGMSRSMSTIVGGYFCNLDKKSAAEYSFLLGFVTLSAATIFKILADREILFRYFSIQTFTVGILIAFIFSILTVRWFVAYLSARGLWIFAWYRLILGISVFFLLK